MANLREHIPLQQGLRLLVTYFNDYKWVSQRAYSTTTRIKTTCDKIFLSLVQRAQRAYSTTTRIKTLVHSLLFKLRDLREHIPLQQGLRPLLKYFVIICLFSQRAYSTTTRIKTVLSTSIAWAFLILREHIPLQQGLRHNLRGAELTEVASSESIFHYNKD